jgi:hypothetical protein
LDPHTTSRQLDPDGRQGSPGQHPATRPAPHWPPWRVVPNSAVTDSGVAIDTWHVGLVPLQAPPHLEKTPLVAVAVSVTVAALV